MTQYYFHVIELISGHKIVFMNMIRSRSNYSRYQDISKLKGFNQD